MAKREPKQQSNLAEHSAAIARALLQLNIRLGAAFDYAAVNLMDLSASLQEHAARLKQFRDSTSPSSEHLRHDMLRIDEVAALVPMDSLRDLVAMQAFIRELQARNAAMLERHSPQPKAST
jgi:hypothetical protein